MATDKEIEAAKRAFYDAWSRDGVLADVCIIEAITAYEQVRASEANADVARYERGLREIGEYLSVEPPRIGDASFTVEALLAR